MTAIPPMDFPSSNGGREILHGIDMEFPKGGFVSIMGESGCGKFTVAAVLMGGTGDTADQ